MAHALNKYNNVKYLIKLKP